MDEEIMAPADKSMSAMAERWLTEPAAGGFVSPQTVVGTVHPAAKASATSQIGNIAKKILTPANITAALTGIEVSSALKQGRVSEQIGEARAAVYRKQAESVREAAVERAKIIAEHGRRLREKQRAAFISGGIKTNVGAPLLLAQKTRADIAKDIGFNLQVGRTEAGRLRSAAGWEERLGRYKREKSKWEAIGIAAGRSISYLGLD